MAGEPEQIEITGLVWDADNVDHIADHGLTPADVEYVRLHSPLFFRNLHGRGGTHVMIGIDGHGWSLYVPIVGTSISGQWRVIAAWRSAVAHRLYYEDRSTT